MKFEVKIDGPGKKGNSFVGTVIINPGDNSRAVLLEETAGKRRKRWSSIGLGKKEIKNCPNCLEFRCVYYDGRKKSLGYFWIPFPADTPIGKGFSKKGKSPKDSRCNVPITCTIKILEV